jgi:large subunit ribosomal protein L9
MEVILLERIERLGQMGDVVNVKPGFARNYLLPNKKAMRASKDNLAYFEKQRAQLETVNLKRREEAEAVAKKMEGLSVIIVRQASESDQLYGSVSSRDVTDAITAAGFTVDKSQVLQERTIKTVGLHQVRVKLHPEVFVNATVNVARSPEEAALQARGERVTPAAQQPEEEAAAEVFEQPPAAEPAEAAPAEAKPEKPARKRKGA